jgi:hypothetical protein
MAACRAWLAGWLAERVVGWLAGWLAASVAAWVGGWRLAGRWLAGRVVGWLAGWRLGWLADWLGGWLDGCVADQALTNNGTLLQSDIVSRAR